MGKPRLIFATLFPENPRDRNEINCITRMLTEFNSVSSNYESLSLVIGSAHKETLEEVEDVLRSSVSTAIKSADFLYCPFKYSERMSERRAHEIGFSKRFIHQHILDMCYDHFLFWIDSDMYIPFTDINRWIKKLNHSSFFVTFPYCVRLGGSAPPEQFGAYVLNTAKLTPDTLKKMYQTNIKKDTICRIGAPDCEFKKALLSTGCKELRAEDIYSEHYDDGLKTEGVQFVYIYDRGNCRRQEWTAKI